MRINAFKLRVAAVSSAVTLLYVRASLAQGLSSGTSKLDAVAKSAYGNDANLAERGDLLSIIGTVISAAIGIVGVIFLVQTIYAGFLWMTARGDEKMVTRAKDTLQRTIIGLIIVLASYAITSFIFARLLK